MKNLLHFEENNLDGFLTLEMILSPHQRFCMISNIPKIFIKILKVLLIITTEACQLLAQSEDISLQTDHWHTSFETLTLPQNEKLGLVGIRYLEEINPLFYGGLGIYSAATGRRGGFFVGGLEGGIHYPLTSSWEAQAGLYLGGGGGGAAPQGGGLMLRPHIGLAYKTRSAIVGVELSHVSFPNGNITSTQGALTVDIPFETFRYHGGADTTLLPSLPSYVQQRWQRWIDRKEESLSFLTERYTPSSRSLKINGERLHDPFTTIGIAHTRSIDRHFSTRATIAGALQGSADGYAEIFGGLRYHYGFFDTPSTQSRLIGWWDILGGMAGGGQVDTGGGLMIKTGLGMSYLVTKEFSIDTGYAYTHACDGHFDATAWNVSLTHRFVSAIPSRYPTRESLDIGDLLTIDSWAITPMHQTYLQAKRKTGENRAVSLIGAQIERQLSENFYLEGQAYGAYEGGAGGFSVGMIGMGFSYPYDLGLPMKIFGQIDVGAAGGGNVDVAGGSIASLTVGLKAQTTPSIDTVVSGGYIQSLQGGLTTPVFSLGATYHFHTLGVKLY